MQPSPFFQRAHSWPKQKYSAHYRWFHPSPRTYLVLVLFLGLTVLTWNHHLRSPIATNAPTSPSSSSSTTTVEKSQPIQKTPQAGSHNHLAPSHNAKQQDIGESANSRPPHSHTGKLRHTPDAAINSPWAITYSPLRADGTCKPLEAMVADMLKIQRTGAKAVRLYSTDCGVLEAVVPTARKTKKTHAKALKLAREQLHDKGTTAVNLDVVVGLFPYTADSTDTAAAATTPTAPQNQESSKETAAAAAAAAAANKDVRRWFPSLDDQLADIVAWGAWPRVALVSVGSGGVFDESYTRAELVHMIRHIKRRLAAVPALRAAAQTVRVTTAEPVQSYVSSRKYNARDVAEYKELAQGDLQEAKKTHTKGQGEEEEDEDDDLCAAVDVVGLIVQPFFNSAMAPEDAGQLVQRDLKFVRYLCSDQFIGTAFGQPSPAASDSTSSTTTTTTMTKDVAVLEAGWPSSGQANGEAVPGLDEQYTAVSSILAARDPATGQPIQLALYTFEDELWREPGFLSVETHFGVSRLF